MYENFEISLRIYIIRRRCSGEFLKNGPWKAKNRMHEIFIEENVQFRVSVS